MTEPRRIAVLALGALAGPMIPPNRPPLKGRIEWEECPACEGRADRDCVSCLGRGGSDVRLVDCDWCGFETPWPAVEMYDGTLACGDCSDAHDDYRAGGPHDVR